MKHDAQFIILLFYFLRHIVFPGTVHIVRASDHFSVQINVCDRVYSVKTEYLAL